MKLLLLSSLLLVPCLSLPMDVKIDIAEQVELAGALRRKLPSYLLLDAACSHVLIAPILELIAAYANYPSTHLRAYESMRWQEQSAGDLDALLVLGADQERLLAVDQNKIIIKSDSIWRQMPLAAARGSVHHSKLITIQDGDIDDVCDCAADGCLFVAYTDAKNRNCMGVIGVSEDESGNATVQWRHVTVLEVSDWEGAKSCAKILDYQKPYVLIRLLHGTTCLQKIFIYDCRDYTVTEIAKAAGCYALARDGAVIFSHQADGRNAPHFLVRMSNEQCVAAITCSKSYPLLYQKLQDAQRRDKHAHQTEIAAPVEDESADTPMITQALLVRSEHLLREPCCNNRKRGLCVIATLFVLCGGVWITAMSMATPAS